MPAKPTAVFIGPEKLGIHLKNRRTEWNFIDIVDNITTFWDKINDETLPNEIDVVITLDNFFHPNGEDPAFENLVTHTSPYCLFLILQYTPTNESRIRERIETQASSTGEDGVEYYFVDPKKFNVTIDNAVNYYISHSENRYIADILAGRDPEQEEEILEELAPAKIEETNAHFFDDVQSDYLGQVIACTSSKGGSGKSTIAISLATYLAHASVNSVKERLEERPLKIVVLDLDVRDGQIGFLIGSLNPNVLNMRSNGINERTLSETIIKSERLGVDVLLAPKKPRLSDDTPPEFYLELIQFLKKYYDYIILDTSVNYLDPLLEKVAYPLSDSIVFVTDIVVNSVYSMTRWIQEVTKVKSHQGMEISKKKIGIVVNKSITNVNMSGEKIAKSALGIPVITVVPNNAKLIATAANMQTMETILKHPEMRIAIRRLARAITGRKYALSDNVI